MNYDGKNWRTFDRSSFWRAKKRKLSVRFWRTVLSDEKDPVLMIYFGVINNNSAVRVRACTVQVIFESEKWKADS